MGLAVLAVPSSSGPPSTTTVSTSPSAVFPSLRLLWRSDSVRKSDRVVAMAVPWIVRASTAAMSLCLGPTPRGSNVRRIVGHRDLRLRPSACHRPSHQRELTVHGLVVLV